VDLNARQTKDGLVAAGLVAGVVLAGTVTAGATTSTPSSSSSSGSSSGSTAIDPHPGDNGAGGVPEAQEERGAGQVDWTWPAP
jgi:hypothetical protein